jgi:hypothetical protein
LYWQAAGKDYTTGKNLIYYKNLNASIKIFFASNETIQHHYLAKFKQLPDQDQNNIVKKCYASLRSYYKYYLGNAALKRSNKVHRS